MIVGLITAFVGVVRYPTIMDSTASCIVIKEFIAILIHLSKLVGFIIVRTIIVVRVITTTIVID